MRISILARPLAASTLLFAAACGGSGATVEAGNETEINEALERRRGPPRERQSDR